MLRLAAVLITLLFFTGAAAASPLGDLCPFFDPGEPQELVSTDNGVTIQGVCTGSMSVRSMSAYQTGTSVSSANFGLSTSHGDTALFYTTNLTGQGPQSTIGNTKMLEFSGLGASLEDSFYVSRVNTTDSACEQVHGGTSAMFSSGAFGSEVRSIMHPSIGIDLTYEFAAGPASSTTDIVGLVGSIETDYSTLQQYGSVQHIPTHVYDENGGYVVFLDATSLHQTEQVRTALESRFTGISSVSGSYHFSTVNE